MKIIAGYFSAVTRVLCNDDRSSAKYSVLYVVSYLGRLGDDGGVTSFKP